MSKHVASFRTPRGQVEGLGAAHSGTHHFLQQRVSAVALVPLAIWFVIAALGLEAPISPKFSCSSPSP